MGTPMGQITLRKSIDTPSQKYVKKLSARCFDIGKAHQPITALRHFDEQSPLFHSPKLTICYFMDFISTYSFLVGLKKVVELTSWPSIDSSKPEEEGGPNARTGFSYQDDIVVSFLIGMLADTTVLKIHCETQDDIVVVKQSDAKAIRIAEYVQVKAGEPDSLWSVAAVCSRDKGKIGSSTAEKSLGSDKHNELSKFRIITLRDVQTELRPLKYDFGAPDRAHTADGMTKLYKDFDDRIGDFKSAKGNDAYFWLNNCVWDVRHSEKDIRNDNTLRLLMLAHKEGRALLPEQIDGLRMELTAKAFEAGKMKWGEHGGKKIIERGALRKWWESRTTEILLGALTPSGGKLSAKMKDARLADDQIALAIELRREYAAETLTPRYLDASDNRRFQGRVRSEVATLRANFLAGELSVNPAGFYALCIERMDTLNLEIKTDKEDHSAFLKGCLYDITDRCLLRFTGDET